jgi:hypothetical protein
MRIEKQPHLLPVLQLVLRQRFEELRADLDFAFEGTELALRLGTLGDRHDLDDRIRAASTISSPASARATSLARFVLASWIVKVGMSRKSANQLG